MLLLTVLVQLLTFSYYQFIRWVNIFPYNNLKKIPRKELFVLNLAYGILMLIPVFAFAFHSHFWQIIALFIYGILFLAELLTWWVPHFFSSSVAWKDIYEERYSATTKLFPRTEGKTVPDLQHIILQLLLFLSFTFSLLSFTSNW